MVAQIDSWIYRNVSLKSTAYIRFTSALPDGLGFLNFLGPGVMDHPLPSHVVAGFGGQVIEEGRFSVDNCNHAIANLLPLTIR
jgi:hypothetical protein